MLKTIVELAQETAYETGRNEFSPQVLATLATVPRHEFVPDYQRPYAYDNRPLPIGHGQTISQPYIVALMTDLLNLESNHIVLEIGTGSGYQAAILSQLVKQVYTIEIIATLGKEAQTRFNQLGYNNIEVKISDGYYGWEEHAPYDAIIATAAGKHIPPPLLQQLKAGGRMIIPIGERFHVQYLTLIEKDQQGNFEARGILSVAFVPLTGKHE
jgi:protein-L-isoaspartate(D-aspartate) O-methyltransferase